MSPASTCSRSIHSPSTSTDLPHQALPDPFGVCNNLLVSLFPGSRCSCSSGPRAHCQHPCPGSLPHAHPTECVSWSLGLSPWQAHHEGYGYLYISSSRQITAKQALGRLPGLHILHSSLWVYCWSKPVVSTTAFTRSKCHLGKEVCVFNSNQRLTKMASQGWTQLFRWGLVLYAVLQKSGGLEFLIHYCCISAEAWRRAPLVSPGRSSWQKNYKWCGETTHGCTSALLVQREGWATTVLHRTHARAWCDLGLAPGPWQSLTAWSSYSLGLACSGCTSQFPKRREAARKGTVAKV